jgi:chromosome segregation ATPase
MPSHLIPRKINFTSSDESSVLSDANKLRNELDKITKEKNEEIEVLKMQVQKHVEEISNLLVDVEAKSKLYEEVKVEKLEVEKELDDLRLNIMNLSAYEINMKRKEEELSNSLIKIQQLEMTIKSQNQDLQNLHTVLIERDENIQQLKEDLKVMQNKCKENDRVLVDLERLKKQVNSYNEIMVEKENLLKKLEIDLLKYAKSERELLDKAEECDKLLEINQQLEENVENLRHELCVKTFSLEKCKIDLQEVERKNVRKK